MLPVSALFLFACMASTTKYLSTRYNAPPVVANRYIVNCALMIVIRVTIDEPGSSVHANSAA